MTTKIAYRLAAIALLNLSLAACGGGSDTDPAGELPHVTAVQTTAYKPAPAVATTSASFSTSTADFANPERGFYGWAGDDFVTALDLTSVQTAYANGYRLVFAKIDIGNYRSTDLSAQWLSALATSFASVRAQGMKVTLLFSYDYTAAGNDATAAQIKRHLEQLGPMLQANADIVPYMRAGFIGAWGEWHSSQSGNSCGYNSGATTCASADANRLVVRDALLANVPATTQIGFRFPPDLQKWYPLPTQQSRAGVHNDCFLSGPTDSGTYLSSADRTYTQALTANAAFGGETCEGAETPVRNSCADILLEGAQYHLAWLNADYAASIINAWKTGGCYSQVSRTMGYRLQLDGVSHPQKATRGTAVAVQIDLRNVGWARLFSARKLVLTLKHRTTGALISASAGNLQTLPSQASASTRISINIAIPAAATLGDYDLLLSAPDVYSSTASDTRFAVRFANADNTPLLQSWNAANATFKLGTKLSVL